MKHSGRYQTGCRCEDCRNKHSAYMRAWHARRRRVRVGSDWADRSKQGDRGGRLDTLTLGEWQRANGYDPATRQYADMGTRDVKGRAA